MKFSIYIKRKDMDVNEHYTQTHIKVKEQHFLSNFCFVSQRVRINFIFPTMYVYCVKVIMQCKENKRQKTAKFYWKWAEQVSFQSFSRVFSETFALSCYRFMKQVPGYCYLSFHSLKRPRYTVIVSNPSLYKKQVQGDSYLCTRRINIRYSENVIADNIRKIC